jgi:ribosome-binding factor A
VYVQIEGDESERAEALKGLRAAAGYIRHELVERLQLRRAPEVLFQLDESEHYGSRIDELLRKVKSPEEG